MDPRIEMGMEFASKHGPFTVTKVISFGMPAVKCDLCGKMVAKAVDVEAECRKTEKPSAMATLCMENECAKTVLGLTNYDKVVFSQITLGTLLTEDGAIQEGLKELSEGEFHDDLRLEVQKALIHSGKKRGTKADLEHVAKVFFAIKRRTPVYIEEFTHLRDYNAKCLKNMEIEKL